MSAAFMCRAALRRHAVPLTLSLSSGILLATRQQPLRFDAGPSASSSDPVVVESEEWLDPNVIKQISGGSLSGLLVGLVVSVFSRTLVLFTGVAMVIIQVAARNGIDLVDTLKLRQRIESSKVLSALNKNTAFKLAFGTTFAMSAFMQF